MQLKRKKDNYVNVKWRKCNLKQILVIYTYYSLLKIILYISVTSILHTKHFITSFLFSIIVFLQWTQRQQCPHGKKIIVPSFSLHLRQTYCMEAETKQKWIFMKFLEKHIIKCIKVYNNPRAYYTHRCIHIYLHERSVLISSRMYISNLYNIYQKYWHENLCGNLCQNSFWLMRTYERIIDDFDISSKIRYLILVVVISEIFLFFLIFKHKK